MRARLCVCVRERERESVHLLLQINHSFVNLITFLSSYQIADIFHIPQLPYCNALRICI